MVENCKVRVSCVLQPVQVFFLLDSFPSFGHPASEDALLLNICWYALLCIAMYRCVVVLKGARGSVIGMHV